MLGKEGCHQSSPDNNMEKRVGQEQVPEAELFERDVRFEVKSIFGKHFTMYIMATDKARTDLSPREDKLQKVFGAR